MSQIVTSVLLHIHRAFFADAMLEHPVDPLKSKYAQSVLATFRAAVFLSASIRGIFMTVPLAQRYWMFTSNWFSACVGIVLSFNEPALIWRLCRSS